jgi:hydroxymethylpyrimidine/phosphomethylpyrimidine kinase
MGYCCEILYYFDFLEIKNYESLQLILSEIDLITPNYNEIIKLSKEETDPESIAEILSEHCAVLLKGGHNPSEPELIICIPKALLDLNHITRNI